MANLYLNVKNIVYIRVILLSFSYLLNFIEGELFSGNISICAIYPSMIRYIFVYTLYYINHYDRRIYVRNISKISTPNMYFCIIIM